MTTPEHRPTTPTSPSAFPFSDSSSTPTDPAVPPAPGETVTVAALLAFLECPAPAVLADPHRLVAEADIALFALRRSDLPIGSWEQVGFIELDGTLSVPTGSQEAAAALNMSDTDLEHPVCPDSPAELVDLGIAIDYDAAYLDDETPDADAAQ